MIRRLIEKLKCRFKGHDYTIEVFYNPNCQKLKCKRCNMRFGINHDVRSILPWDAELESCMRLCYPEKYERSNQ